VGGEKEPIEYEGVALPKRKKSNPFDGTPEPSLASTLVGLGFSWNWFRWAPRLARLPNASVLLTHGLLFLFAAVQAHWQHYSILSGNVNESKASRRLDCPSTIWPQLK